MDNNSPDTLKAKKELEPRVLCDDLLKPEEVKSKKEGPGETPREKELESSDSDDDYDKYLEQLEQEHS